MIIPAANKESMEEDHVPYFDATDDKNYQSFSLI